MSQKIPRITVGIEDREGIMKRYEAIMVQSIPNCVLRELENPTNREITGVLRQGDVKVTLDQVLKSERETREAILEGLMEAPILRFSTRPVMDEIERVVMGQFYTEVTKEELKCPIPPKK